MILWNSASETSVEFVKMREELCGSSLTTAKKKDEVVVVVARVCEGSGEGSIRRMVRFIRENNNNLREKNDEVVVNVIMWNSASETSVEFVKMEESCIGFFGTTAKKKTRLLRESIGSRLLSLGGSIRLEDMMVRFRFICDVNPRKIRRGGG